LLRIKTFVCAVRAGRGFVGGWWVWWRSSPAYRFTKSDYA
jgi:hypothetical protein